MPFQSASLLLLSMLLLAACGEPTPDEAKRRLAGQSIPVTDDALLAKTKEAAGGAEAARLLVQAGVDPNARQANGMTALMSAAFNGQREVAEALIKRGAEVNATAAGFTALRLAVERGDKAMVRLLLDHGAKPNLKPDGAPSAMEKAEQGNATDILELLKKAGAS